MLALRKPIKINVVNYYYSTTLILLGNALVVGASRSLVTASEQDARTTQTPQNLCGELLLLDHISYEGYS